jgi:hypothetical protein
MAAGRQEQKNTAHESTTSKADVHALPAHPVPVGLKLPRRPRTIKPLLNKSLKFRTMSGNGLMNDAWLG